MASDLPRDPREREIFLRALREYSESCEPPGLTPDCPYSIPTKDPGVMGCGEECMDLLGKYNAPRPREEIQPEAGIWIRRSRRPRARRTQQPLAKSYDARQVYLEDQASGPAPRWRLAAILYGLLEVVTTPPSTDHDRASERRAQIYELIRLTEGRGLNFDTQSYPPCGPQSDQQFCQPAEAPRERCITASPRSIEPLVFMGQSCPRYSRCQSDRASTRLATQSAAPSSHALGTHRRRSSLIGLGPTDTPPNGRNKR